LPILEVKIKIFNLQQHHGFSRDFGSLGEEMFYDCYVGQLNLWGYLFFGRVVYFWFLQQTT
jgi:hypothetical protein